MRSGFCSGILELRRGMYIQMRRWGDFDADGVCLPVIGIGHHAHLALDGSNLLLRGRLRAAHSEERHFDELYMVDNGETGI